MIQSVTFRRGLLRRAAAWAWPLGVTLALFPQSAFGQSAADPAAEDPAAEDTAEAQPARSKVLVVVRLGGSGLDTARLLTALRRELPSELTTRSDVPSDGTLVIDLEASDGFVLGEYTGNDGRKTARIVARPADPDEALDVIALLAGNLVRNEAKDLLQELERAREAAARKAGKALVPPPPPAARGTAPTRTPVKNRAEMSPRVRTDTGGVHTPAVEEPMPKLRDGGVLHLSLFYPLALDSRSEELSTDIEFGLFYSRVGESRAFALNPIVLRADARAQGLQLTGIFAYAKRLEGVQIAGGLGVVQGSSQGVQLAGIGSWAGGPLTGAQVSGLANVASGVDGLQLSNFNVSRGGVNGFQLSGLANIAGEVEGLQFGPLNLADAVQGLQVGAVNLAGDVDGIQVGLVNVADEVDGAAIGMVSIAKNGRIQPTLWVADGKRANAGVSFEVGPVYSLPFLGADPVSDTRRFEWGLAVGIKGRIERVWGAIDLGYSSEQAKFDGVIKPLERARVLAGVELIERSVTLFGGVGVHTSELRAPTPESHFGVAFF